MLWPELGSGEWIILSLVFFFVLGGAYLPELAKFFSDSTELLRDEEDRKSEQDQDSP